MPILVVDDYSTMIRIIRNLLRQLGFQDIDDAPDGSVALSKMHIKRYGLVISDWNMEPMTGYELLKQVRSDPSISATPFIMVTAESKTENVDRRQAGRRQQLHRQAVQRRHAEEQDRSGVRRGLSALQSPRQSARDRLRRDAGVGEDPVQRRQIRDRAGRPVPRHGCRR